jgi:hypothetical protein
MKGTRTLPAAKPSAMTDPRAAPPAAPVLTLSTVVAEELVAGLTDILTPLVAGVRKHH